MGDPRRQQVDISRPRGSNPVGVDLWGLAEALKHELGDSQVHIAHALLVLDRAQDVVGSEGGLPRSSWFAPYSSVDKPK